MTKKQKTRSHPLPRSLGSTQRVIDAKGVFGSFLWLGAAPGEAYARRQDSLCAVIEVGSINYQLLSASEQQTIITAFYHFLMAAETPLQILVQIAGKDMKPYLEELRVASGSAELQELVADHAAFIESLSAQRILFDRRFYLVLPVASEQHRWQAVVEQARHWIQRKVMPTVDVLQYLALQEDQLQIQVDETIHRLSTMGLHAHCLTAHQAVTVYHSLLHPAAEEEYPVALNWGDPTRPVLPPSWQANRPANQQHEAQEPVQETSPDDAPPDDEPHHAQKPASSPRSRAYPFATLADRLAPGSLIVTPQHLIVDGEYQRTVAIMGYPRYVTPGWMLKIIGMNLPMTISLHLRPRDSQAMIHALNRRLAEFAASDIVDKKRGRIVDQERVVAQRDTERLRDRLQQGEDRIVEMGCAFLVRGATLRELDTRASRLLSLLRGHLFIAHPMTFEQEQGLRSCLPEVRDRLKQSTQLDVGTVATAFPFGASTLSMLRGVLYGMTPDASLIILDPFSDQLENANHVVFAKSGAGKSYACKVQALRNAMKGVAVTVIDPENEWADLCHAVGGTVIRFAGGSDHCLNPFDLVTNTEADTRNILAEKILSLLSLLSLLVADAQAGLTSQERSLLEKAVAATYAAKGITADLATHRQPPPILADLVAMLRSAEQGADTTHLADRLDRYVTGSLGGLFNGQTNVTLDRRFAVFNVRDMEPEIRPLVLFLITDFVWTRMRTEQIRQPRLLYIDEAWTLMQHPDGGQFISSIARRARKYYLGLVTITQDVADFLQHEHGRTVLANASIRLVMKQDASTMQAIKEAFRLSAGEAQFLLTCQKGEGVLFARGTHVAMKVYASEKEHVLVTTSPREVAARDAQEPPPNDKKRTAQKRSPLPAEVNHA